MRLNFNLVRRSARLASRFRPDRASSEEVVGVPAAGFCASSLVGSVVASASSRASHRAVPGRIHVGHGRALSQGYSLRTVRIVLEKCDRLVGLLGRTRRVSVALENCDRQNRIINRIGNALNAKKRVRFADPIQTHLENMEIKQSRTRETNNSLGMTRAAPVTDSLRSTGIRIIQLNMRRSQVVSGEVRQLAFEKRLDVLLLQEPYVRRQGRNHIFYGLGSSMKVAAVRSQRPWAAVAISNPNLDMLFISQLSNTHCVCVEVQAPGFSFYVVSCYFQYSDEIEKHLRHLETVCHSLRGKRLLVALDANARSSLWGPQRTDERGAKLADFIRAFGLQVLNDAIQPPTFWTTTGSSYIDVTLASPTMSQFIGEWKVRQEWTSSDHNSVDIRVRVPRATGDERGERTSRFDTRRADWDSFSANLRDLSRSRLEVLGLQSAGDVELIAQELTVVLQKACESSMPRKRRFRKSNPWWTRELTVIKKSVYRLRRSAQGAREEPTYLAVLQKYRSSLREYSKEVKRAKLVSWRKFVTSRGNAEAWGYVYRQQADKLRVEKVLNTLRQGDRFTNTVEETASYLLDIHVPEDRECDDSAEQRVIRENSRIAPETIDTPLFTELELVRAVRTFKNNKAPGPDLIEVSVLKMACRVIPNQIVKIYNGCLQWGVFPSVWKRGSLRVLLKGGDKDEKDPKSYRPICLLSVVGKLFEKLVKLRLDDTSMAPGNISGRQFGFMPGRSTEDAIVELRRMVSSFDGRCAVALLFDISGAFDNVWWPLVLDSLKDRNCPRNVFKVLQSYFRDRNVQIELGHETISKKATRGCPQGSVLGPACWNIMFDGLLRRLERVIPGQFVAYADDLIVVINGNSRKEIEQGGQRIVDEILDWCRLAKLEISKNKTEGIALKSESIKRAPIGRRGGDRPDRKRKQARGKKVDFASRPPVIKIGEKSISFRKTVRYLGVWFDQGMGVKTHCEKLGERMEILFSKLGKLGKATWGLRYGALSTIYKGVFAPTVTYAAAGWADLCTERDLRILKGTQRRALIPVVGAYRTTSREALCVVAGATPVEILLQEGRARYEARKGLDAEIGQEIVRSGSKDATKRIKMEGRRLWQAEWNLSTKGRTTYSFFKDVGGRMDAEWIRPDHWSAQVLTGHGDFRARLASLGLADSGACDCGGGDDTVAHFLIDCKKFEPQRVALRDYIGADSWGWPDVAPLLVKNPEAFSLLGEFCRESLWLKGFE